MSSENVFYFYFYFATVLYQIKVGNYKQKLNLNFVDDNQLKSKNQIRNIHYIVINYCTI